jgi:hypothetical protein
MRRACRHLEVQRDGHRSVDFQCGNFAWKLAGSFQKQTSILDYPSVAEKWLEFQTNAASNGILCVNPRRDFAPSLSVDAF